MKPKLLIDARDIGMQGEINLTVTGIPHHGQPVIIFKTKIEKSEGIYELIVKVDQDES